MSFPVELAPQPSRLLMAGLVAGYVILGVGFFSSSLPAWAIATACVGLASSAVMTYRRWRQMAGLRFVLGQEGMIQVTLPDGAAFEARAGEACRDLGWAVWLAWHATGACGERAGREGILMLPRDALPAEAWRALRIWLKFRSGLTTPEAS